MAHWYSPSWEPDTTNRSWVQSFKPSACRWNSCRPSANELDMGVPMACQIGSAVVLQNEKKKTLTLISNSENKLNRGNLRKWNRWVQLELQFFGTQFCNPLADLENPNPNFKLRKKLKKTGGVPESGADEYHFRSEKSIYASIFWYPVS
jgi:hypothetical protein